MEHEHIVVIDGNSLTLEQVELVASKRALVELSSEAINKIERSRAFVEKAVANEKVIYGLTTGFAANKNRVIAREETAQLQVNLIRSHAIGVGTPFSEEVVRTAMLIRANSLAKGYSGVRIDIVNCLIEMINKNVYPKIPCQGSVGASGDLAPLSHMVLVMMGEGEAFINGVEIYGLKAMKFAGIKPIILSYKEGLALNNGTAFICANAAIAMILAKKIAKAADIIGAASTEVMMGTKTAFRPEIHDARPHEGQQKSAKNLFALMDKSEIVESHKYCNRIQDSYCLRCIPQVHGACRDAIAYVEKTIAIEINSATDNPLIFEKLDESFSCGNFHGEPLAIACDTLGIALAEFADISERRIAKMIDSNHNQGLPIYLINETKGGLNSGFMIPQYTAASLVSENKVLAHPASVDSIPTSANSEDHVSMGSIAARKALEIAKNTIYVLSIEAMLAAQAVDLRKPLNPGIGTTVFYNTIRSKVDFLDEDRIMYRDLDAIRNFIVTGELIDNIEKRLFLE